MFAYSQEDGTRAGKMAGQISGKVKQKRRELAMAAQHKVAMTVSESFVGREIKVLVEGEANAKQLQGANVSSWEHGLIRETDRHTSQMKGPLSRRRAARRMRRTLTGAFMCAANCRLENLPKSKSSATRITI